MNQILAPLGKLIRSFDRFCGDQVEKQQHFLQIYFKLFQQSKFVHQDTNDSFENPEFEFCSTLFIFKLSLIDIEFELNKNNKCS